MSFQPIIPSTGLAGWQFLQNTLDRQVKAHEDSPIVQKAVDYFAENIAKITSPKELVQDRRLLEVALGAFGLSEDINNKFFIEKILAEGTSTEGALANKLADKRYAALADAFGFDTLPQTGLTSFSDKIIAQYERRSFEVAVGAQNDTFRIGLNLERELPDIAAKVSTNDSKWFAVMGNPALREVFQTAFGLPSEFAQVDLDQQLAVFKDTALRRFGTNDIADFASSDKLEELTQLYFLQDQIKQTASVGSASIALTLLQSTPAWT